MIRFVAVILKTIKSPHYRLALGMSFVLLTALLMTGCAANEDDNATSSSPPASSSPAKVINKEGNYITAEPNPTRLGGLTGKTTISWGTKGIPGLDVHVYIYGTDGKEQGMFATGSAGTQEAPWISKPTEFRLVSGSGADRKTLDSVTVTLVP